MYQVNGRMYEQGRWCLQGTGPKSSSPRQGDVHLTIGGQGVLGSGLARTRCLKMQTLFFHSHLSFCLHVNLASHISFLHEDTTNTTLSLKVPILLASLSGRHST